MLFCCAFGERVRSLVADDVLVAGAPFDFHLESLFLIENLADLLVGACESIVDRRAASGRIWYL